MKLNLKTLPDKTLPRLLGLKRFLPLFFFLFFAGLYGFLILRINTLAATEPSDAAVSEELQSVQRPQIDEAAAEKIERLEAQNIEIRTLFNEARRNPFAE